MKSLLVALTLLASSPVLADSIGANPNDYGKVTAVGKGVMEIDLGGLLVLSHNKSGDGPSTTRVSTLGGAGFQYFLNDNVSVGGNVLFNYDRISSTTDSTAFGGSVFASLHVRLGLGAFLRPTLGAGVLVGNVNTEGAPGMVTRADQVAGLVRIGLPIAYFASKRIVLQAGPELNVLIGSAMADGGDAVSFTSLTGGFGIAVGYTF